MAYLSLSSRLRTLGGRITDYFSIGIGKKVSLAFILIFTTVAVIDSTIVKFFAYSDKEFPPSSNVTIFILFSIVFVISGISLLISVKKNTSKSKSSYKPPIRLIYFYAISVSTQVLMIGIILSIIFQMMIFNKYNIVLLHASTLITHLTTLLFLLFLVFMFLSWFKSRRNYIVILYLVSFSLISANVFVSMVYLEYQFWHSTYSWDRKPYPIHSYITRQEAIPSNSLLKMVLEVLYLLSFLAIWIATAILLTQYRSKLGRLKYFVLICVPLIYYLFTFQGYFGNVFSPLLLAYPILFNVIYVLAFSATKQVGALLFSITFLTSANIVTKDSVRKSILISAIGTAILFGSLEITTLQYRLFPPFGLITEAFMPLGSYLLFIGIFTSATYIARDGQLRKEFYKSAQSQLALLKTIGVTQMEKELENKFKSVQKRTSILETAQESYPEEGEVKEIIRDVLNELYSKTKGEKKE